MTKLRSRRLNPVPVIIGSGIAVLAGCLLWGQLRDDGSPVSCEIPRIQAEFLARGALQLARLKAKCCPEALHEAVQFSLGRNPHHSNDDPDSSSIPSQVRDDSGPAYLTGELADSTIGIVKARANAKVTPGSPSSTDPDDLNSQDGLVGSDYTVDRYLNFFLLDLADRTRVSPVLVGPPGGSYPGQGCLSISATTVCPVLGDTDPYSGSLQVVAISVLPADGNNPGEPELLHLVAKGDVTTTVDGVAKDCTVKAYTNIPVPR